MRSHPSGPRGVSTMVSYVLVLGISSILITGLLLTTSGYVTTQRESTVRDGLEIVGQQLADDLSLADRMVQESEDTSDGPDVQITHTVPRKIAGVRYSISITPGPPAVITLTSHAEDITADVRVWTTTAVASSSVTGGKLRIVYDTTAETLVVENV